MFSVVHFPHLGSTSAGVASLPPRFRKFLDETVKTFALFPSCYQLLDCDDKCILSVPSSTFTTADGEVGESARCCPLRPSRCFAMMFMVSRKNFSSSFTCLSNNTAEMTAMVEALSFLGPRGPVARDEQSCIFYDTQHAAGVCLGTIQARSHVQLALACQRSMLCAQHRLRLTMQHVYGHSGNLGNECADHAAALGTFGFTSRHNVATRWFL